MQKTDFHGQGFYEDYLKGRLSDEVETLFEEHLLFCEKCRKELSALEIIFTGIKEAGLEAGFSVKKIKSRKKITLPIIGIAASILLIIGGSVMYFTFQNNNQVKRKTTEITSTDSVKTLENTPNTGIVKEEKESTIEKTNKKINLLAEVFSPSEFHENLLGNILRAEQLKVLSPSVGQTYSPGSGPVFEWEHDSDLILVIMNNKGEILREIKVTPPYSLTHALTPGLYYWQIENEEEALYTSKFFIR